MHLLFQCVRDGKLSKGQAEVVLNKKSSSSGSSSHSLVQKAATFSATGGSSINIVTVSNCEDSKAAAGTFMIISMTAVKLCIGDT